ncbi:hypothetical protein SEUCBS139899_007100 [Sporothrix eucalyptigena]|uniref:Fungal N-terminal domain-containing protein n=1 Tax=Sporothrix eucalyptigena TaxID=1812306 RepID=A0ABP0CP85_9PEZI
MASVLVFGDVTAACGLAYDIQRNLSDGSRRGDTMYTEFRAEVERMRYEVQRIRFIAMTDDLAFEYAESIAPVLETLKELKEALDMPTPEVEDPFRWENKDRCTSPSCSTSHAGYVDWYDYRRHENKSMCFNDYWSLVPAHDSRVLDTDLETYLDKMDGFKTNPRHTNVEELGTELWATTSLRDHLLLLSSNGRMKQTAACDHCSCSDDDDPLV